MVEGFATKSFKLPYLCRKYRAHINLEVTSNIHVVKYLYTLMGAIDRNSQTGRT
jgi:hypothetical protein